MWQHDYLPVADSLSLSAGAAALPIFVLLLLVGVLRKPAWIAALAGLATATGVAVGIYAMPASLAVNSIGYGAAFGLLPIGWIVYWAIVLYRLTVETGQFAIIKDSIGGLTPDRRLQAMLIAFAFGAFIEGAAGFGTPVAVAAAMLAGLGFSPFYAAGICLLANTAPVAFGSIGTPIITLAGVTGLPEAELSAWTGRLCAPISVLIPAYLMLVMGGRRALRGVWPAAAVCGLSFAILQLFVSNHVGPQLTDIIAALAAIAGLILLFRHWQPRDGWSMAGDASGAFIPARHSRSETLRAWSPYALLVVMVLIWGSPWTKPLLDTLTIPMPWPGLHNQIERIGPVVAQPTPYAAIFSFSWLSASGTACALATLFSAVVLRVSPLRYLRLLATVGRQLFFSLLTIASVLALAYLMNYSGATVTLGLAFAATGALFPFFSALLGWLGVFLTGSDTSANALFGNLQVVTATRLGFDPAILAAANSAGGVMGKMISLQSIAVAVAATGMSRSEEGRLFRFTLGHSVFLASLLGVLAAVYAYLAR